MERLTPHRAAVLKAENVHSPLVPGEVQKLSPGAGGHVTN